MPYWEDAVLAAFISNPPLPSSWKELYLVLGSSSAGLIGLLFVATSLHLAEIANEEVYRLRAQYTMLVLLSTLVASIGVLMPQPITVSRARASGCKFVGTFVSDHVAFKGDQDSGLTMSAEGQKRIMRFLVSTAVQKED